MFSAKQSVLHTVLDFTIFTNISKIISSSCPNIEDFGYFHHQFIIKQQKPSNGQLLFMM
ncbi:hypothetical protein ACFP3I_09435 [Chryseobacterium arachidis]|uniref:hypothetical protein n=1 Tax=Chryseobacterium arachidis TaxID=1416778 RepID=UPI003606054B